MTPSDPEVIVFTVSPDHAGTRLDALVSSFAPNCSRACAGKLIRDGRVAVNNTIKKSAYKAAAGDRITVALRPEDAGECKPEPISIAVLHTDSDLIVINKPPGMVIHPAAGNYTGTLVHGLLYHFPEIRGVGLEPTRPGIVHRLDKDTSGVLLVARSQRAYESLSAQFKQRSPQKTYIAIVNGAPTDNSGIINLPIYRHPVHRKKMAAGQRPPGKSRFAETSWRTVNSFGGDISTLECRIKTGRTHQIRVHLAAIGHPVIGDPVYGFKHPLRRFHSNPRLAKLIGEVDRQMLHAHQIEIRHPGTGDFASFEAPLPPDMNNLQSALAGLYNGDGAL